MKTLKKFWTAVKRNPVINAFVAAVAIQVLQDYRANAIDRAHIFGYACALVLGIAARMLTVPAKEHEELKGQVSNAILAVNLKRFEDGE